MGEKAAPQHVIDSLEASTRDVAAGNVRDVRHVQARAERLLADYNDRAGQGLPSATSRTM